MNNKTIVEFWLSYELKYYVDLRGCYPPEAESRGQVDDVHRPRST